MDTGPEGKDDDWVSGRSDHNQPLIANDQSPETAAVMEALTPGQSPRVTFNVGGVVFQTRDDTIKSVSNKNFKLANGRFLAKYYDTTCQEYFFDRDPEVFRSVLNYWRSGRLHLPSTMCGPQVEEELKFWGLSEIDIEPCCWNNYNTWMQTIKSLKKMERDRDPAYLHAHEPKPHVPATKRHRFRVALWNILTDPSYSLASKIYAYIALLFVVLAIFSFCASTHKFFQTTSNDNASTTTLPPHNGTLLDQSNATGLPYNLTGLPYNLTGLSYNLTGSSNNLTGSSYARSSPNRKHQLHPSLLILDLVCLVFFTAEYLLRLACAPKRCKFLVSAISVLDFLAILPDYIELIVSAAHPDITSLQGIMEFMPFLRLMRAFRIFRLIRRVPGLWIMMYTLKASFKELSLMLVFLLVGTILFSSLIFFVDDPEVFHSIPHSFWWAIVTMTTVGYGDMTPSTPWGQLVGSVTAVCGVLIIGFTIPSLVNNFITFFNHVEFVIQKERLLTLEEERKRREGEEEEGGKEEGGKEEGEKEKDKEVDDTMDYPHRYHAVVFTKFRSSNGPVLLNHN